MPIREPPNPDVLHVQRKLFSLAHVQANDFIDDCAVALGSAKSVPKQVGRIQDIIKEPKLPKIQIAR
jgi:hypothetical protein